MSVKVFIVEDEPMIIEVLKAYLEKGGYIVDYAMDGLQGLQKIKEWKPDFVILDLMLPGMSGESICEEIRKTSDVPIMMLSAKTAEEDRIGGIVIGADDYVTKPFSPREVIVRMEAILRRTNTLNKLEVYRFNEGELVVDLQKKETIVRGNLVSLTPIEYELLTSMIKYPGRVFSRTDLLKKVQEDDYYEGYERSIDVHIKNLRKKLEEDTKNPTYILTVFGMGYKFGGKEMFHSLRSKLLFFFLILSLGGILLVSIGVYYGFQETFHNYLQKNRDNQAEQVKAQIENDFIHNGAITIDDNTFLMMLHHLAMNENMYFRVETNGGLILDTTNMGRNMSQHGMHGRMGRRNNQNDNLLANYEEKELPLENKLGKTVGKLTVIYPTTFINSEDEFFSQFSKYLIAVAIFMVAVAILLSFVFSKRLTQGLNEVSTATKELKARRFHMHVPTNHHIKEVDELAEGVNELALSLKKGEELRKQFTSDLAHELRTPLATLRSQIESFQDGIFEPSRERLDQCHHELMRLVRLVNEMEKLHTVENPNLSLNIQKLHVGDQVKALEMQFESIFSKKGVHFLTKVKNDATYYADPDRFTQMMTNVLNNALKYTREGGTVQLVAVTEKDEVCFIVEDDGQGMTENELNHVFERFYRGEKSRNRKTGGLGIGLSIVKALVDAHKGRIEIESEKNKGTKVKIYLKKSYVKL